MTRENTDSTKVIIFGKMPPPYTGSAILTQTFANMMSNNMQVECIDTSINKLRPNAIGLDWLLYNVTFAYNICKLLVSLWSRVRSSNIDVFYMVPSPTIQGHLRSRIALEIAEKYVSRVVLHVHSGNYTNVFYKKLTAKSATKMVDKADAFIFSSQMLSRHASNHIPESKRVVVHNTIDEHLRCTDEEVKERINDTPCNRNLRVLYLSNMIKTKGYRDVSKAVRLFNSSHEKNAIVDFVGKWPSEGAREEFEDDISQFKHEKSIRIHGQIKDRNKIRGMMLRADVFTLPTYYPTEAQPVSIIEALNAGTPVIATDHASIPEYVFDGVNGYHVEKKSPSDISSKLKMLCDCKNWTEKARAARKVYNDMFSYESVREQLFRALLCW